MQLQILVGVALLGVATGIPLGNHTISTFQFTAEDINHIKQNELYVFDDNEKPVRLTWNPQDEAAGESDTEILLNIKERVFFHLYTRKNPKKLQNLVLSDVNSLRTSNFNANRPTKFITHGWINSHRSSSCRVVRDAYLQHGDYNVIVVDWSKISVRPYSMASRNVKTVGQHVAKMIDFLKTQGMNLAETTLIGHSLGAHVMGLAGYYAKGTVNYIIGLDPALPGFSRASSGSRIAKGDAKYVEIIHTNAGLLGYNAAIGDSDFYPNGGTKQPGCVIDLGACSHCRAFRFLAESITSSVGFHAMKCRSYLDYKLRKCNKGETSIMGEHKRNFWARGTYYLDTNKHPPFARGR